jgi:hypothetical protein
VIAQRIASADGLCVAHWQLRPLPEGDVRRASELHKMRERVRRSSDAHHLSLFITLPSHSPSLPPSHSASDSASRSAFHSPSHSPSRSPSCSPSRSFRLAARSPWAWSPQPRDGVTAWPTGRTYSDAEGAERCTRCPDDKNYTIVAVPPRRPPTRLPTAVGYPLVPGRTYSLAPRGLKVASAPPPPDPAAHFGCRAALAVALLLFSPAAAVAL